MKKLYFSVIAAVLGMNAAQAEETVQILDLTNATTELKFDATNGMWTETYNEEAETIDSQCFSFVHSAIDDMEVWWGFTASNSDDNARQENTLTYQFSNMAPGGIVLEDGQVKKDDFGAVVTSKDVPYLVAYYGEYFSRRPVDMTFEDGKSYVPVGVYVNLNSYPYYCIEYGDGFARAFTNGDKFTLTIHGVAADESEKTVEVELASYSNGNLTINRGWMYVDLSELGAVNELYFTMDSTDKGTWGINTPTYFCMDKLTVKEAPQDAVKSVKADAAIRYDRASKTITTDGFAMVCDVTGNMLMSGDQGKFDLSTLPAGVYLVKCGVRTLKIAK